MGTATITLVITGITEADTLAIKNALGLIPALSGVLIQIQYQSQI